jgi:hypothetical protein
MTLVRWFLAPQQPRFYTGRHRIGRRLVTRRVDRRWVK